MHCANMVPIGDKINKLKKTNMRLEILAKYKRETGWLWREKTVDKWLKQLKVMDQW